MTTAPFSPKLTLPRRKSKLFLRDSRARVADVPRAGEELSPDMTQDGRCREKLAAELMLVAALAIMLGAADRLPGQEPWQLAETTKALYRGDAVRAAALAERYLKVHPGSPAALILLARAEMAQAEYISAYRHLWKALRADPKNIDALYYLAHTCLSLSHVEHQALYALAPDSARVHQLLAESYQAQENTASAEEEYLAALQAAPESPEVLNSLGDLKRLQFKFDEAITYYARAAAIRPRDYVSAYGLGACYLYLHKPERAVEYLRRALAIEPDSAPARLALGDALLRAGAADEAVTELKAAVAVRPDMRQAYTLLARAYRRLGQSREAEEALRKSNELAEAESRARQELLTSDDLDIGASAPDSAAPPPAGPKE